MTVSTSVGRQFTVDRLVTLAYRKARLRGIEETPNTAELQHGRDTMDLVMDDLEAQGEFARVTGFVTLGVTVDVAEYSMPVNVLDILNPAMYIDPTNTDVNKAEGETPIDLVVEQEWTRYSSKAARGRPTKMYADREGDIVKAVLWPRPDESGGSIRYRIQRKFADSDDGNATIDLQNYWMLWLVTELAAQLASGQSLDQHAQALAGEASRRLKFAKGKANERAGNQVYVSHGSGWN